MGRLDRLLGGGRALQGTGAAVLEAGGSGEASGTGSSKESIL